MVSSSVGLLHPMKTLPLFESVKRISTLVITGASFFNEAQICGDAQLSELSA